LFIIDRFEGEMAVIEHRDRTFNFPRYLLPPEAKEGQALSFSVTIDQATTKQRRAKVERLLDELVEE